MTTRQAARKSVATAPASRKPAKKVAPAPQVKPVAAAVAPQAPAQANLVTPVAAKPVVQHSKVVRDGFTMPQADYDLLKSLKAQCLKAGVDVKKSELLRAGVQALAALSVADLSARMKALPPVKAGRRKSKA